ncbi:MGH1-like glycoside hydrolase domain-containing protein [Escherichia coli]|uniref:MGH1-like glycoside hydrolase domain-containing protein n=1 Tax=Escherichia coli TaxID=562 RepID=UPI003D9BFF35
MSWLVAEALERHGDTGRATNLRRNIARLAADHDFPEYVNPWTGEAHGTRSFSWTAALALETTYLRSTPGPQSPRHPQSRSWWPTEPCCAAPRTEA